MSLLLLTPAVSIATKPCMWCTRNLTVDWCETFLISQSECVRLLSLSWELSSLFFGVIWLEAIVSIWRREKKQPPRVLQQAESGDKTQRDSVFAFALYYICTSHFLRPLNCTPRLGLIKLASEISVEHPPEVVKHTSRPTFGCVINHVEIKVKGEGLTLSSES